jgi:hypothetical protein
MSMYIRSCTQSYLDYFKCFVYLSFVNAKIRWKNFANFYVILCVKTLKDGYGKEFTILIVTTQK